MILIMNIKKFFQRDKEIKFLCVGDMVADAFIQLKQAEVTENINHDHKKINYRIMIILL